MSCWVSLISSANPCRHRAPKLPANSTSVSITRRSTDWVIARITRRSPDRFDLFVRLDRVPSWAYERSLSKTKCWPFDRDLDRLRPVP
jgi:hypothetical protein